MHLKIWPRYAEICKKYAKICKNILKYAKISQNMHIQTETIESLFNDSYRFLKFHMIGVSKKNMIFHTLHNPIYYSFSLKLLELLI
jgi:aromatic ring-opening dioxygenase LigB subunit